MTVTSAPAPTERVERRTFRAIGTTATVVVRRPHQAERAAALLRDEIDAMDLACSRFRADSELCGLLAHAGQSVVVSARLFEALDVGCAAAARTQGAVDPTVGNALEDLGYDRDFEAVARRVAPAPRALGPVAGYGHIHLSAPTRTVRIPRGVRIDLGATAKALIADRAAARIGAALGGGVLVSLGGEVAVAGEPPGEGWPVGIALDSAAAVDEVHQVVTVRSGGLASSSTTVRTWVAGGRRMHHIVDPATGRCAPPYWSLVSVVAPSCVEANTLTTAAVVWGPAALDRLPAYGCPARLVRHDGSVVVLGGWPA